MAHTHHEHQSQSKGLLSLFMPALVSLVLLLAAIILDNWARAPWFDGWVRIVWYLAAYLPCGFPVLEDAWHSIIKGNVFSEFFLMGIATIGAFAIGEYPEGVAVMLFYTVGENFQSLAVRRAKGNIKALLDQRPDMVTVLEVGRTVEKKANIVRIGEVILLKPGEKLALDGELQSERASFNTAALTGESKPDTKGKGDGVLAGMVNLHIAAEVRVTTAYEDSKLSRILDMVQHATTQKAPTELFISRFAKIYTPAVVLFALAIVLLPALFVVDYVFRDWLYRGLVFLVISCPCALVISIPLGYFGGIGAASRHGILVKGSNFLDVLAHLRHVVVDKTGTLTEGIFEVQKVKLKDNINPSLLWSYIDSLEAHSSHPIAAAIRRYVGTSAERVKWEQVEEVAGHGLKGTSAGKEMLVGNFKLMDKFGIPYDVDPADEVYTTIAVAFDGQYQGYLTIADSIKDDAGETVNRLHKMGVQVTMLSGDKVAVVRNVASELGIKRSFGDLLPEDKVNKLKEIKARDKKIAFVGDGLNDAPVIALSDVGIAMGGLGSDAAIETADVVIQDDSLVKIPLAITMGKKTRQIVWQNITLAFAVKAAVLLLGAGGLATMWEAVFADVGVALLAILNAVRIQRMKF